ncbi:alpha-L-fucosidase [Parapedobacter deserti]|uniref:alpha-L-fucosidase n=1 Tax=Parapedobacter deserti TaxID=1912957 RepID=A0ABV7JU37_9SPHI
MKRRDFVKCGIGAGLGVMVPWHPSLSWTGENPPVGLRPSKFSHRLPKSDGHYKVTAGYVEENPIPDYTWAPDEAYEEFMDMKFGIRLHWGLYAIFQQPMESWQFLDMSFEERQAYQELYKSWNPGKFDATAWVNFFADSGARMFSFTTKHHDGFSMYDTSTRIKSRVDWMAEGGPAIVNCDLAYSIMETPFGRDVTKELCEAAHRKGLKIDLYFSHPDWYDTDFRPYNYHPIQVPSAGQLAIRGNEPEMAEPAKRFPKAGLVMKPDPTSAEVDRMMDRHRRQLEEIITKYGEVTMVCLDQWLGPTVWPRLRDTLLHLRKLRPNVMYRARGIGNYGDYYTPEGFVPGSKENTDTPWFVIFPLAYSFSYDPNPANHKGTQWMVRNLVDIVAKGGNFMVGIGPDGNGEFHKTAINQLKDLGNWLKINGEGIYKTRPRDGDLWHEGAHVWFTRSKDNRTIYAFVDKIEENQIALSTIQSSGIEHVNLLGVESLVAWTVKPGGELVISMESDAMSEMPAVCEWMMCFKITLKS